MHGGGKSVPNLRHVFPSSECFPPDLGHINELSKWSALNPGHDFARWTNLSPKSTLLIDNTQRIVRLYPNDCVAIRNLK